MIKYVEDHQPKKVMMVTECSMSDNVQIDNPKVEFIKPCNLCPYMKKITLPKILECLENETGEIIMEKETIDKARYYGITLLVVTNGASYNSYRKRDQLSLMGLDFSNDEIISSREVAEIFLSYNKPEGPLGIIGNMGNDFIIPDLHCIELKKDFSMFDEVNSFILLKLFFE